MTQTQNKTFRPLRVEEVDYLSSFQFEKDFDLDGWREWFDRNWTITLYASFAYILFIFGVQSYLKTRSSFKLTGPLAIWNVLLTVFSLVVFIRTAPEMFVILTAENGFHNSVCRWTHHNPATAFWSFMMLVSKLIEFGDTVFIVLRKQNLIFLHWYHHVTTLVSWWLMYASYEPNQLWYIVMNSFVHSIMYFYYFLKALKVRVPVVCSMAVTCIQLAQMVGGIAVNVYAYYVMVALDKPKDCDRGIFGLKVSFWMYTSFFILFAMFFYDTYWSRKRRAIGKSKPKSIVQDQKQLAQSSEEVLRPKAD